MTAPVSKSFLGLFGGSNPFMKPSKMSKTLIATPSKFEIRSHPAKSAAAKSSKSAVKKTGVHSKVTAKKTKVSKAPKVSQKSKQIAKEKNIKKLLKAKIMQKKEEADRKRKEQK